MPKSENAPGSNESSDAASLLELGRHLTKIVAERGVTDRKLAQTAGVSRTNVRYAKNGANITLLTLLKLARALGIRSLSVGELAIGSAPAGNDIAVAEELKQAIVHLTTAVALLEGNAPNAKLRARNDDSDAQAAALIRDVVAKAKTLGSGRLRVLEETLRTLTGSAEEEGAKPATRRAKRRRD
ncbi:MAG: hypothetical protein QOK37_4785 [Thermoanaerobaculia bacterium]|nr:hypothetical protein [Thermoanaerobaculia bacterium]